MRRLSILAPFFALVFMLFVQPASALICSNTLATPDISDNSESAWSLREAKLFTMSVQNELVGFEIRNNGIYLNGELHESTFETQEKLGELMFELNAVQQEGVYLAHLIGRRAVLKTDGSYELVIDDGLDSGPAGVGNYTQTQLRKKAAILKVVGLSKEQRKILIEEGVVGWNPFQPIVNMWNEMVEGMDESSYSGSSSTSSTARERIDLPPKDQFGLRNGSRLEVGGNHYLYISGDLIKDGKAYFRVTGKNPSGTLKIVPVTSQGGYGRAGSSGPRKSPSGNLMRDPYSILGLPRTVRDRQSVKSAHNKIVMANHPDKLGHLSERERETATRRYDAANEAWAQIKKERGW